MECQALRPSVSSSHSLFFRVLLETQEFQASQELMALQVTQAMRAPQERKEPRVCQGQQALWATLDLGA